MNFSVIWSARSLADLANLWLEAQIAVRLIKHQTSWTRSFETILCSRDLS